MKIKNYLKKSIFSIIIIATVVFFSYGERLINIGYSIDTEYFIYDFNGTYSWMNNLNRWGYTLINKIFKIGEPVIFQSNFLMIINIILSSILICYLIYTFLPEKYKDNFIKIQFIIPCIFYTSPIFAEQFNFTMQCFAVSLGMLLMPFSIICFKSLDENKKYL